MAQLLSRISKIMSYLVNIGDEKTLLKSYVRSFLVCFIAQTVISNISYLVSTSNITLPNTIYHNMKVFRLFLPQKRLIHVRSGHDIVYCCRN